MPTRLAYSYSRLSSAEQMKGTGLTRQLQMAKEYAAKHSLTLSDQTFRDLGISGYTGKNIRAGALGAFIALVEKGRIKKGSILLIEQLDRYTRLDPLQGANQLQRLLSLGVEVHTLADGRVFTKDSLKDIGSLFYSLAVLHRAYDESKTKSFRGQQNWKLKRQRAAPGMLHTKMGPGWLSWDGKEWTVDAKKARAVVRVFEMTADGYGAAAIARTMNREKVPVPTRRGSSWHSSTIHKLTNASSVIGTLQVGHRETSEDGTWRRVLDLDVPDYYPAIVSKRLWLKTRRAARPRVATGPKKKGTVNLFAKIAICGACRGAMHYVDKGESGVYLVCSNARRGLCKTGRGWRYERFEPLVLQLLKNTIRWETLIPSAKTQSKSTLAGLEEQLAAAEVERETVAVSLKRIVDAVEAGAKVSALTDRMVALDTKGRDLEQRAVELRERVEAERERLRGLRADVQESKAAFADWQSGGETARHRLGVVLRRMLKSLVLTTSDAGYGPAREPRRLEVVFRDAHEGPETFHVSADLLTVSDTEGEDVVALKP